MNECILFATGSASLPVGISSTDAEVIAGVQLIDFIVATASSKFLEFIAALCYHKSAHYIYF